MSKILSGGVSASMHAVIHPPGRHPHQQTATAADGTHPTGMHSCFYFSTLLEFVKLVKHKTNKLISGISSLSKKC